MENTRATPNPWTRHVFVQVHHLMIFHLRTSSPQNENTFMSSMDSCNDSLADDAMCREIIGDNSMLKIQMHTTAFLSSSFFQSGSAGPSDPMSSCTVVVSRILDGSHRCSSRVCRWYFRDTLDCTWNGLWRGSVSYLF